MISSHPPAFFLTGTDTDAGKSIAAAWFLHHLQADYWKPVQSGLEGGTDRQAVQRLSDRPDNAFHPCSHTLQRPLSPHESARLEGVTIQMDDFHLPQTDNTLVVEGAGGLLVPLNQHSLMIDLMVQLGLPVVLTARTTLGTINHTLLSLEAMRARGLTILGVVLSGPDNPANRRAIRDYGRVAIIGEIPWLDPLDAPSLAQLPPPHFPAPEVS